MKRFQIMGVALIAMFAFCVVGVASAGALTTLLAEWLIGGKAVTATTAVSASGTLLLEDTNAEKIGLKASVECTGSLDGTVGTNGADEVTVALTTSEKEVSKTALSGESFSCTDESDCEAPKVWAVHLPWSTTLVLAEETTFIDKIAEKGTGGKPGWYVECTILGIKATDECLAANEAGSEAKNVASGVEGVFSETFNEKFGFKLALCSSSGEETGIVAGTGITKPVSGTEILSVSE
jgi:hypothetical protein